jgi:hypothetical protein
MTGGLLQLVAYGIENIYLTEDPQITFFKIVYRRHTNFSIESIQQNFNSAGNFGNRVSCSIAHNGDLINRIYVVIQLPIIPSLANNSVVRWVDYVGYALIKTIELEIGGKIIDTHYGEWLYIWNELNKTNNKKGLDIMTGNVPALTTFANSINTYKLYIPLEFWFCNNLSLSLPIIALEHSEVKINIEFNDVTSCLVAGPTHFIYVTDTICLFTVGELLNINGSNNFIQFVSFDNSTLLLGYVKINININLNPGDTLIGNTSNYITTVYNPSTNLYSNIKTNNEQLNFTKSNTTFRTIYNLSLADAYLYVDYVYLDNMERVKFARSNHEYLINVLQFDNDKIIYNSTNKIKLGYSHPTKEIIVRGQLEYMTSGYYNDNFNFTTNVYSKVAKSLINKIQLTLNGFNREQDYGTNFYTYLQAYQHHKSIPPLGLYMYSFALNPFNPQPSGSCNFSKIDDITLNITVEPISYSNPAKIRIYAFSYNIFRILNGVGGLVFSN